MNDRGMIKWAPFSSVISSNEMIKEIEEKRNKIVKPILSNDQLSILNDKLIESYYSENIVTISYYKNGIIIRKKGIINNIDFVKKMILITNIKLHISQIIQIN